MFQKTVGFYNAVAVAGDRASQNVSVYAPFNFLASEPVTVGNFCWADPENPTKLVKGSSSEKVAPLGFIERELDNQNYILNEMASMTINARGKVAVAVRGDFYVKGANAAVVGNSVFAKLSDGSVKFGATGASVDGYVETNFKALTAGDEGDLIIISNWA